MLNKFGLGGYYSAKSFIHSMNSTAKIICVFTFALALVMNNSLLLGLFLLGFNILLIKTTNIPINLYLSALNKMKFLLVFIFIINILFNVDIFDNILMIIKVLLLVNYSTVLTLTTSTSEITYGLERFLSPLNKVKVPVNKISLSISLALRFIPTVFDEATKILKSQASRGVDYYKSNLKGKLEALKGLIIPMFNLSIKRADMLGDAMEVRLFSFDTERSNYRINKWKNKDILIVIMHLILLLLVIVKEVFV